MKLKPLGSRVVLKEVEREEVTKGGIVLPSTAKEKPNVAEVIEVGPGEIDKDGREISMVVKKGDRVLYSKYAGTEVKVDEEYLVIKQDDILAIVE